MAERPDSQRAGGRSRRRGSLAEAPARTRRRYGTTTAQRVLAGLVGVPATFEHWVAWATGRDYPGSGMLRA